MTKYVIISPVRNEEQFLSRVIKSMTNQTILPTEWVIVDDGSSDKTGEIIKNASKKYNWIKYIRKPDRGSRSVGPGVVEAFYYGYDRMITKDYDYIVKMDGDIEFGPKYVEKLLTYFDKDKYLGSASGKIFFRDKNDNLVEERTSDEMTVGAFNFYRRQAFEDIGGFVKEVMWDGIAFHKCRIKGWRTKSISDPDLQFIHKRIMGSSQKSIIHGRVRWGFGQYFMGTHPLYILAITAYRMLERPYIVGGLCILFGYIKSFIERRPRYNDKQFRNSLHAWQLERLRLKNRLEVLPVSEENIYKSFPKDVMV